MSSLGYDLIIPHALPTLTSNSVESTSTVIPRFSRNISCVSVDFQWLTAEDRRPLQVYPEICRES